MRRLAGLFALSVMLYLLVFGVLVDRPLSLGALHLELLQKTERLRAMKSPKIVILAGSNGPYSHSCTVIGAMLGMPCENAGIAVGIGLDDIFVRYAPYLHAGDVLYMPMELQQYTQTQAEYDAGVDGGFLIRHDRGVLPSLPPMRVLGSIFCCTLADLMESVAEMPLAHSMQPETLLAKEYDEDGDRIDNDLAGADPALLNAPPRAVPPAQAIRSGYGTALIEKFIGTERKSGVTVIGGLPVDFAGVPMPPDILAAISEIYIRNGGLFLTLPNMSHYPARDFFNSEDHLAKPCQYLHSIAVAGLLGAFLNRQVNAPDAAMESLAASCPSGDQGRLLAGEP